MPIAIAPTATHTGQVGGADRVYATGYFDNISDGSATMEIAATASKVANVRRRLTANTIIYVASGGSDANDGLTVATSFATISRAVSELIAIDGGGYQVTINIGSGSWPLTSGITITDAHTIGMTRLNIYGSGSSSTIISSGSSSITLLYNSTSISPVYIENIGFEGGAYHIRADAFPACFIGNVSFGSAATSHIYSFGGSINISAGYSITGAVGTAHIQIANSGNIVCTTRTITITGNPSLVTFINVRRGSYAQITGNTFTGTCTGRRFVVGPQSVIETGTADVNHLPGTTTGTVSEYGGYYF